MEISETETLCPAILVSLSIGLCLFRVDEAKRQHLGGLARRSLCSSVGESEIVSDGYTSGTSSGKCHHLIRVEHLLPAPLAETTSWSRLGALVGSWGLKAMVRWFGLEAMIFEVSGH